MVKQHLVVRVRHFSTKMQKYIALFFFLNSSIRA